MSRTALLLIIVSGILQGCLPPRKTVATEREKIGADVEKKDDTKKIEPAPVEQTTGVEPVTSEPKPSGLSDMEQKFASWSEAIQGRTGGDLGIAVVHIESNTRFFHKADTIVNSASSAKWLWAAAALAKNSAASLAEYSEPTFRDSSNEMAGRLIDFAGGIPDVNSFGVSAGLSQADWSLCKWSFSASEPDSACNMGRGGSNFFTARSALQFLEKLAKKDLPIPSDRHEALLTWGAMSPKTGTGGWSASRLPAAAKEKFMHKSGWIPAPEGRDTLNDLAIMETKTGLVALAVTMENGNFEQQKTQTALFMCLAHHYFASGAAKAEELCL